jgi:hypothetical protein
MILGHHIGGLEGKSGEGGDGPDVIGPFEGGPVRAAAAEACETLRRRSHERFNRLAAVDRRQQDLMSRECVERAGKRAETSRAPDADVGIRAGAREADSSPAGH